METGRTRRQTKAAGGARGVSLPGNAAWQLGVLSTAPLAPLAPLLAQIGTKAPDLHLRRPKRRPEHLRPTGHSAASEPRGRRGAQASVSVRRGRIMTRSRTEARTWAGRLCAWLGGAQGPRLRRTL